MFRDLLSRRDLKFKLKHNRVIGNSDTPSGSTGIPTVDKNTQPNIVWREPTSEDLAKFHSFVQQVADLSEGKLPLFLVMKMTDEGEEYIDSLSVLSVRLPGEGTDGIVNGTNHFSALIAEDWSLLGILRDE